MKSRFLACTLFLLVSSAAMVSVNPSSAQTRKTSGMDLSLQGGPEFPVGDSGVAQTGSYGFTLTASLPMSASLDVTAGIGYLKFGVHDVAVDSAGKTGTLSKQTTNYPFFAGLRFVIETPVVLPYFGAELSLNDLIYHTTGGIASSSTTGVGNLSDVTSLKFGYAFVFGTRVPLGGDVFSADATVKYHVIPNDAGSPSNTYISLNAGIAIHLSI